MTSLDINSVALQLCKLEIIYLVLTVPPEKLASQLKGLQGASQVIGRPVV